MKLTTKQLKQIIKEELDLLQLPFEWASIKKEWESFYWRFEYHNREILSTLKYDAKEKNQTIKNRQDKQIRFIELVTVFPP